MTPEEKKQFVESLTQKIATDIKILIDKGRIPANWDGFELRQLLADKFRHQIGQMSKGRMREYNNTVLVNDL